MDCRQAFAVFPDHRVLVASRWRAPFHFTTATDEPDFDLADVVLGQQVPDAPLEFRRVSGTAAADMMGTDWACGQLVSDRLVDALQAVAPDGWALFDVVLRVQRGEVLSGYQGLSITGRTGPLLPELSLDALLPPFVPNGPAVAGTRGWCFDPDTWDGSDVFSPTGTTAMCVTAPVAEHLRSTGVTGLRLERMSEMEMIRY